MNCLQALAVASAALVMSGEPLLQPLTEAHHHIARVERVMRTGAEDLLTRIEHAGLSRIPDAHIHASRVL